MGNPQPAAVDLKREIPTYRARPRRFDDVVVPPQQFLMIDGHGDPNTAQRYTDALTTLYPVAYALKFLSKRELGRDHVVMPLEALWWADDLAVFTTARDKTRWDWTVMIALPDWITAEHVDTAREQVGKRGGAPLLDELRCEQLDEGRAVQTLHIGPYDDEAPVLARLHDEVIPALGLCPTGRHHEIYLSDARRTAPEKLRTVLRQPVTEA